MTQSFVGESWSETFDGTSVSGRQARGFVRDALNRSERDDLIDVACVCVGELAANAILHARGEFTVGVTTTGGGVRVEVADSRPWQVPMSIPAAGTAADLTAISTTGRGLRVVAALARRWGVTVHHDTKSVWAELEVDAPAVPTDALVIVDEGAERHDDADQVVRLLALPVRAAVASGVQVDDLVREVQLGLFDGAVSTAERDEFYDLLDRSAPARLAGRYAALAAAKAGQTRFDLAIAINEAMISAVGAFSELLAGLPARSPSTAALPPADVVAFREWLRTEVAAQATGAAPAVCPLPA